LTIDDFRLTIEKLPPVNRGADSEEEHHNSSIINRQFPLQFRVAGAVEAITFLIPARP
jgi:hypothetical protein